MENQRLKFVLEAADFSNKLTFGQLCKKYNISPKTGYKWFYRFEENGRKGLKELPKTPLTQPTKIQEEVEHCIIGIRTQRPHYGPKKIRAIIQRDFSHLKTPSEGSIGNILKKHNLSKPRSYRRHVAKTAPLADCNDPNDVWMYDFKGQFKTIDGSICEPLTITDGYSRFLIDCVHMRRKREIDVWMVLERAFKEFGLPLRMRSDNGPPFATISVGRLSRLAVKLIKVGITPEWIEPGCPEQNGRHERFHLTLKKETAMPPALTLNLQMEKFRQFQVYYNNIRPHEALCQKPPSSVYRPSNKEWDGKFRSPEYPNDYEVRKVEISGHINWRGIKFFISEVIQREYVGIKEIDNGMMGVYYGPIFLGKIDLNKGFKRR